MVYLLERLFPTFSMLGWNQSCSMWFRLSMGRKEKWRKAVTSLLFKLLHVDLHDFNWASSLPKNANMEFQSWLSSQLKACSSFSKAARTPMSTSGCNGQQFGCLLIFLQRFDQILSLSGKWVAKFIPFKARALCLEQQKTISLFSVKNNIRSTWI